jgi:NADH:ubiquinone oxidoreductase subunit E
MSMSDVESIVRKHANDRGGLISILEEIQARYSYLPKDALKEVATATGRSLVDIYGVATFYRWFSLKPRGKHIVSCCQGTACHVRGAPKVIEEFGKQLAVAPGDTTADKEFTLETVNCLGACALGPITVVDGHYFSNVDAAGVKGILGKTRDGLDKVDVKTDARVFPVEVSCAHCNHSLMDASRVIDGVPAIRVTISFGQKHGTLLLSSLYGSYAMECEHEIPDEMVVDLFCAHCHAQLRGATDCVVCSAPMVPMIVRGGGVVQICSRRGCTNHMLDLNGVNL